MTGQAGPYDIGFLVMKTESQDQTPSTDYVVGRLKRRFLTNSWVGGLVTDRESSLDGDYNRVYGIDTHLQFFERLELDSFLLRSDTPGLAERNQARQFEARWRDDEWILGAGYNEIQTNFNPKVGFRTARGQHALQRGSVLEPSLRKQSRIQEPGDWYNVRLLRGRGNRKDRKHVKSASISGFGSKTMVPSISVSSRRLID